MNVDRERFFDLVTKKLTKEATTQELEELEDNLTQPQLRQLLDWIEQHWHTYSPPSSKIPFDTEVELQRLHERISEDNRNNFSPKNSSTSIGLSNWLKVAAVVLVFVTVGVTLWWVRQTDTIPAAQGSITDTSTFYQVEVGQVAQQFTLGDGTVVWLNADSKLEILPSFGDTLREVILEGEAFFDVKRDTLKPFIIRSGELYTEVLGTSFNVSAYESEPYSVAVETGKVRVANESTKQILLQPNQQVHISTDGSRWHESETVAHRISSWRDGVIWFDNSSLETIVPKFERRFNVKFRFKDNQTRECVLGGKISMREISGFLFALNEIHNIEYEYDPSDKIVYLKGGTCN